MTPIKIGEGDFRVVGGEALPVIKEPKPVRFIIAGPPIPCSHCGQPFELCSEAKTVIQGDGMVMVKCPKCLRITVIALFPYLCTAEAIS